MTVKEGGSDSAPADVLASEALRVSELRTAAHLRYLTRHHEITESAIGLALLSIKRGGSGANHLHQAVRLVQEEWNRFIATAADGPEGVKASSADDATRSEGTTP